VLLNGNVVNKTHAISQEDKKTILSIVKYLDKHSKVDMVSNWRAQGLNDLIAKLE